MLAHYHLNLFCVGFFEIKKKLLKFSSWIVIVKFATMESLYGDLPTSKFSSQIYFKESYMALFAFFGKPMKLVSLIHSFFFVNYCGVW
jgi:hypothetical protein